MNIEKRSAQLGAALLIFSVFLRLLGALPSPFARAEGILPAPSGKLTLHRPSGGISITARPTAPPETTVPTTPPSTAQPTVPPASTAPTAPTAPTIPSLPPQKPAITFTQTDMAQVRVRYGTDCGYRTDLEAALLRPLAWNLDSGEPAVLIIHSHGSESFTKQPGDPYQETTEFRTMDTAYNMVGVGDLLAAQLEKLGIVVIHDRQIHDHPSYSGAYASSRKSVEAYLREYPSIRMVLDLHRDAATNADGSQYATSSTVNGQRAAQIMLLAGTDWKGGNHPDWEANLSLALKLQVLLERQHPGITRQTLVRGSAFNQELCSGMLIVEVGTAGNTLVEALRTIPPLAQAIAALAQGANLEG